MADKRIANIAGMSTTGVARGILIEATKTPGHVLVTITGVDGKRHASTLLDIDAIDALIGGLTIAYGNLKSPSGPQFRAVDA